MEEENCLPASLEFLQISSFCLHFHETFLLETKTFFKDFILRTSIIAANRNVKLRSLIRAFGFCLSPN